MKRLGFSKSKASRDVRINRETVSKYWDMSDEEYLELLAADKHRGSKLDEYRGFIADELQQWSEITSAQIHDHLSEKLIAEQSEWLPSQRSVQWYVASLREELGLPTMTAIRQHEAVDELPYGKQAQPGSLRSPLRRVGSGHGRSDDEGYIRQEYQSLWPMTKTV